MDTGTGGRHLDYTLEPMIDQGALRRMKQVDRFASVEVSARVGVFGGEDDAVAEPVSKAANAAHAERLTLKLFANQKHKKGMSLTPSVVKALVSRLLKQSDDIDKLVVVSDDEGLAAKDRMIDLLKHKIHKQHPASSLEISAGRYTHGSKIDLLRRTCRGWLTDLR
jgi:hypothetical protein